MTKNLFNRVDLNDFTIMRLRKLPEPRPSIRRHRTPLAADTSPGARRRPSAARGRARRTYPGRWGGGGEGAGRLSRSPRKRRSVLGAMCPAGGWLRARHELVVRLKRMNHDSSSKHQAATARADGGLATVIIWKKVCARGAWWAPLAAPQLRR
jgi:hypothetical protein